MELQQDGETLLVRAGVGWKPGVVGEATTKASDRTSEGHALKTGAPMISPDIASELRFEYPEFLRDNGVKAIANVPIVGLKEKAPFGILEVDSRKPREFTEDDTTFLSTYANLISAGVERFRITGDLRDREARLRESESRFRDSEARLRSLIEGIPQLVFRSRSSGKLLWGSAQWVAYTGLPEEQNLGLGWLAAVHPDDRAATLSAWAKAEELVTFSLVHRMRNAEDGSYRWFQSRATPIRDVNGHIVEWFGTSTDIDDQVRAREILARSREELEAQVNLRTQELRDALASLRQEMSKRERAEAAVRQMQKMEAIGLLTGGIAHDFNNMLQGIASSLDIAGRRMAAGRSADALRFHDLARQTVERAGSLTRRLLSFARKQRLEPTAVDPDALVAGMADLIRRTVGPTVHLDLQLRDGQARILCDLGELESALLNLCINAHDAMPDGGTLTISTSDVNIKATERADDNSPAPGDFVAITVADTGTGMPREVLERVFEPFFSTKPMGRGTGLGLSQVYGFVRQSGGFVQIESSLGKGTSVCLLMPRQQGEASLVETPTTLQTPKNTSPGQTVLLVEDEEVARETAAERLRDLGYRVLEARDGPGALQLLEDGARIDMLVTDVGLPNGMNGRQVAEAVLKRIPGVPLLFITGYAGTELPPGGDVIEKPFTLDGLAQRVQVALMANKSGG
jgi:PAS domain S-box-containing protein